MPRRTTKTKTTSKKKVVKKPKKVQLPVRISRKTEKTSQRMVRLRRRKHQSEAGPPQAEKTDDKPVFAPADTTSSVKAMDVKKALAGKEAIMGKQQMSEKKQEAKKEKEEVIKKVKQQEKKTKKQLKVVKHIDSERMERDKRLMMWAGVTFFMVLIFGAWVFNLKNIFKTTENTDINNSAVQEWDKIADEFTKTLEKVKEGMAELKEIETEEEGRDIFSETATTSDDAVVFEDDEINELKKRLEELENQIKADEEQATSTP